MRFWRHCFAALGLAAGLAPAAAQDYPNKPVRIIVPFAPGGSADVFGRAVAQHLQAGDWARTSSSTTGPAAAR